MNNILTRVKETLRVEGGTVKFHTRSGRGSGKGVEIPSDQFEAFLSLLNEKARELKQTEVASEDSDE